MAMQFAARAIAAREADLYVVAGVDSYCDRLTLEWLDQTGSLLSATNRNGFPPGEAAGACVLASSRAVRQYQLPVLAQVAAAATCVEPKTLRSAAVCVGEGLTTALKTACSVLDRPAEVITATYCDLNGERYRNEEFVYTLLRVQDAFLDAHDYTCPADCWGDVGAASGPLFAALAVAAVDRGYAKGILPLLWTGSISGYRSAVVLRVQESSSTEEQQ
jgi:3-oxoacyl-[acyl-carrier-protein] synthase-1